MNGGKGLADREAGNAVGAVGNGDFSAGVLPNWGVSNSNEGRSVIAGEGTVFLLMANKDFASVVEKRRCSGWGVGQGGASVQEARVGESGSVISGIFSSGEIFPGGALAPGADRLG